MEIKRRNFEKSFFFLFFLFFFLFFSLGSVLFFAEETVSRIKRELKKKKKNQIL